MSRHMMSRNFSTVGTLTANAKPGWRTLCFRRTCATATRSLMRPLLLPRPFPRACGNLLDDFRAHFEGQGQDHGLSALVAVYEHLSGGRSGCGMCRHSVVSTQPGHTCRHAVSRGVWKIRTERRRQSGAGLYVPLPPTPIPAPTRRPPMLSISSSLSICLSVCSAHMRTRAKRRAPIGSFTSPSARCPAKDEPGIRAVVCACAVSEGGRTLRGASPPQGMAQAGRCPGGERPGGDGGDDGRGAGL